MRNFLGVIDLDDTLVQTHWRGVDTTSMEDLVLAEGALAFLEKHNGAFVLLSQGDAERQNKKIDHLGIRKYFRDIKVVSGAEGKRGTMRALVHGSTLNPSRIFVIGDRPDREIRWGNELGCTTIRMCLPLGKHLRLEPCSPSEKPRYAVATFEELDTLLSN